MKVSYLITCSTETDTLRNLLSRLIDVLSVCDYDNNELIVLQDEDKDNNTSFEIISTSSFSNLNSALIYHPLNNDYGSHKNFGITSCSGDYIFQIDGDEMPPDALLGDNLHELLKSNPSIEAYAVPRINDFKGVTDNHAKQWGWKLTESSTYKRPIVNWPDYQWRIFKRDYPRISFKRRLHEKIEGYNSYSILPLSEEYALHHDKTIEKQIETNLKYNQLFSKEENNGHDVFGK